MRRTTLVAVSAALLLAAGCGVSDNAPRPGVAAQVDGATLSLSTLDDVVDAICTATAADPQGQATTRGNVATQQVANWIRSQALIQYAAQHDLASPRSVRDLSTVVPGWDQLTDDQRSALETLSEDSEQADAISKDPGASDVTPSDFDIVVNPRFGLDMGETGFKNVDTDLSVPVSSQALAGAAQPTAEQLAALPASEICGRLSAQPAG